MYKGDQAASMEVFSHCGGSHLQISCVSKSQGKLLIFFNLSFLTASLVLQFWNVDTYSKYWFQFCSLVWLHTKKTSQQELKYCYYSNLIKFPVPRITPSHTIWKICELRNVRAVISGPEKHLVGLHCFWHTTPNSAILNTIMRCLPPTKSCLKYPVALWKLFYLLLLNKNSDVLCENLEHVPTNQCCIRVNRKSRGGEKEEGRPVLKANSAYGCCVRWPCRNWDVTANSVYSLYSGSKSFQSIVSSYSKVYELNNLPPLAYRLSPSLTFLSAISSFLLSVQISTLSPLETFLILLICLLPRCIPRAELATNRHIWFLWIVATLLNQSYSSETFILPNSNSHSDFDLPSPNFQLPSSLTSHCLDRRIPTYLSHSHTNVPING